MFAAVYADRLRYDPADEHWEGRDRFLLSTGHYAIGLYAALAEAGIVPVEELATYGSDDSRLPMSGMATYTPGMEISGRVAGPRPSGRGGAGPRAAIPQLGLPGLQLPLRRRAQRGFDVGGGHGGGRPPARQPHRAGRHQRPPGRRSHRWRPRHRADPRQVGRLRLARPAGGRQRHRGRRRRPRPGRRLRCRGRETERGRALRHSGRVRCPLLENREKAHFMRIDEHEWQVCREQLSRTAPEGVSEGARPPQLPS